MPRKEDRQTFMFSATFPDDIQKLATEFLRDYIWVGVGRVGSTVENITQQIFQATASAADKLTLLLGCLEQTDGRTLVFVQKKRTANWLCESLRKQYRIRCEEIHGDRSQAQRENALRQFRDGNIRLLIATDVAARGLDVPAVTHVIQFDMPLSAEDFDVYVHRIGRTGRAGMPGLATSFYVPGREVGEGNGKIASCLLRLFEENNQEVPEWFTHIDDLKYSNYGAGSSRNNFRGSRGGMQNRGGRFGSRDMRYNQQGSYYDQNIYQQGRYNSSDAYQNQGYNRNQDWNNGGAHRGYNNRMAQAEMPSRDVRMQYNNNMYAQGMYQNTLPRAVDQTPQLLPAAVVNGSMPVTLPMESPASPVVAGFSQAVPPNAPVGYYDPFTGAFVSGQMPAMQSPSMASMTNQFQAMGVQAGQATVDNMAEQYQMYAPRMNNDMYGDQRGYGMAQQQMYKQQQYPMAPTGGKSYNAGGNQAYGFSAMNVSYPNQMGYNTAQYGQQSMNKKNFYNQNGYNGGKYTTRDDTGGGRPGEYRPYNDGTANGSQN